MHAQVMTVTPPLAESWLQQSGGNRTISQSAVDKYARSMARGEWHLNHQGVAFDDSGRLSDGHHRLKGVIKSGVPVNMLVVFGASRKEVDTGRSRSFADSIRIAGQSEWINKKHIEVSNSMLRLFSGEDINKTRSVDEMERFCNQNKDALQFTMKLFRNNRKGISTAGVKATIATAFYHVDLCHLHEFADSLYSGVISSPNKSALIRAREELLSGGFSGGSTERRRMAKRLSRAIIAFSKDEPLSKLMEPKEYPFLLPKDRI